MVITTVYKWMLLVVIGLTVLSLVGLGLLAFIGAQATDGTQIPAQQRTFAEALTLGWHSGFGALLGLLGGKAADVPKP